MNIAIEAKKSEGAERLLQVTIPLDAVNEAKSKAARKLAGTVSLPGFRPGKAPLEMVMKRFGEAIRSEAIETLVQDAYKEVLEREQLKPAAQPHIHDLKFEENAPVTFDLHLELRPEVSLTNTQGFKVTRAAPVGKRELARHGHRCLGAGSLVIGEGSLIFGEPGNVFELPPLPFPFDVAALPTGRRMVGSLLDCLL